MLLYKPVGPGSQSLLGSVRRLAGTRRVGHGGTLDPFASGLLPVAVGRATRLVDRLHSFPKTYEAQLRLGLETDSLDLEGEVQTAADVPALTESQVRSCLSSFVGALEQTPPAYSAARIGGRRAYEIARAGGVVDLAARTVEIHELALLGLAGDTLTFQVTCSSGTYVRSLGRDIAAALGTVGHLTRLVRTRVGPFRLEDALTAPEMHEAARTLGFDKVLIPPDMLLRDTPAMLLTGQQADAVRNGAPLTHAFSVPPGTSVRAYEEDGALLSLLSVSEEGSLSPTFLLK
ncbi:MAG: tRNA pseudouridine(55) synthase TruB [Chloroflexota bacterium]|nr:tRNA pseudouridine(55) synthase TruB [Chloroflexota bacterium]